MNKVITEDNKNKSDLGTVLGTLINDASKVFSDGGIHNASPCIKILERATELKKSSIQYGEGSAENGFSQLFMYRSLIEAYVMSGENESNIRALLNHEIEANGSPITQYELTTAISYYRSEIKKFNKKLSFKLSKSSEDQSPL